MSFEGLDAIYSLNDAQVLAGLTRVERAAYRHAGMMDRAWSSAGRSLTKFATNVNLPRAAFAGIGGAVVIAGKAVKDYERAFPDLAFQSKTVSALNKEWLKLAGSIQRGVRELDEFAAGMVRVAGDVIGELQDGLAETFTGESMEDFNDAVAEAERFSVDHRREMEFQGLLAEAVGVGAERDGDPIHAAEVGADRQAREALARYAKLAAEGKITIDQSRILSEIVRQQGQSSVDAARAKVGRDARAGAAKEQKKLDEENAAALKAASIARERLDFDMAEMRIGEQRLKGLDKEANIAEQMLKIDRQRSEILNDQALSAEERAAAVAELERIGASALAAIASRTTDTASLSVRGVAAGAGSSVISRLTFGSGTGGGQRDPALQEARKQTQILTEIKDRVGPARFGE